MSASGQMPSDYGEHWSAALDWHDFGPCGCGVEAGRPCRDRRMKYLPPKDMWTAHPGRQRLVAA